MGLSQQSALLRSQVHRNEFGNPDENSGIMFKASSKSADGREALPVFAGTHNQEQEVHTSQLTRSQPIASHLAWHVPTHLHGELTPAVLLQG